MERKEVSAYGQICVGDKVLLIEDSGFLGGVIQHKTVNKIVIINHTAKEATKLHNPMEEVVCCFSDGSTAGTYDKVVKCEFVLRDKTNRYPDQYTQTEKQAYRLSEMMMCNAPDSRYCVEKL